MTVRELRQGAVRLGDTVVARVRAGVTGLMEKPGTARALGCALRLALGAVLGAARILGDTAPFGPGFVAAAGPGAGGLSALLGSAIGAVFSGGFTWSVKYVAIAALAYAASFVFRGTSIGEKRWFLPCVAAFMAACTGFVYILDGVEGPALAVFITETLLVGVSAYVYSLTMLPDKKLTKEHESRKKAATLFMLITVLISLSAINLFGVVSLGRVAAVVIILSAASRGGSGVGGALGAAMGFAMDATADSAPFFTATYTLAAVVAGACRNLPRAVLATAYVIANAGAALWNGGGELMLPLLTETFAATVIFMLLPSSLLTTLRERVTGEECMDGPERFIGYLRERTSEAAAAMGRVYECLRQRTPDVNDEDVSGVFDMAACSVCEKCAGARRCWQSDYQSTRVALNDATPAMVRRGQLEEEDLAEYFRSSCGNIRGFVAAVNAELRSMRARRMYKKRLNEGRDARLSQYTDMEALIRGVSDSLTPRADSEREAERRLKLYLSGVGAQLTGGVYRDGNGRLHIELEGVGAGEMKRDAKYLEKLSAAVGVRLCEDTERSVRGRVYLLEAEPLAAAVGMAAMRREGQRVNGDASTYFKTVEGVLCVVLSDGMGSGERAAAESSEAISLLEGFLRAGVSPELSMRLLSSAMMLKSEDTMGAATVDLMCINLFTGETGVFKYGAAPTYLRHNGSVKRLSGESFSVGLSGNTPPDCTRLTMKAGSVAVIVSDGVGADGDDGWLRDAIAEDTGNSPRALARSLLEKAVALRGASDDMTVLTIAVTERE